MKTNQKGIDLIKHFEGCYLEHYKCPAGVWTIGYGHTGKIEVDGKVMEVANCSKITEPQAEDTLKKDLARFETGVEKYVKVPLTENQFAALVSFSFNLGLGNLQNSTLLKKVNAKDYNAAADEFPKWKKAGGKVLQGLVRRRAAERELFLTN